ncbi:glycosyltransferase family 4 protein [Conexibacter woesei]|uniref:glycosyltransferase family 4 protein n=1 Tax=Conexibacter woesei TaxID=191495 RepID=UPI0004133CFA|nr:glycosyltransferase family 1 protein [Conexibacter woesei]
MKVGWDLLFLRPGQTGGRESYSRELARALRERHDGLELIGFAGREAAGDGWWRELLDHVVVLDWVHAGSSVRWAAGEAVGIAGAAARARVDVLHGVGNFGALGGPFARVLTVHDVLFKRRPDLVPPLMRVGTGALMGPAARRAHVVLADSHASGDDAVELLGVRRERVEVVPLALGALPRPGADAARARTTLDAGDRPIVLCVAGDFAHKNLAALLDAWAVTDETQRPLLVYVGPGTDAGRLAAAASALGVEGDVRVLGTVSAELLEDLYAAAGALALPTRFEGFGLPLLEAMARGVPVVCSDLPVLREIGGDQVLYVDPDRPEQVAAAIGRALGGAIDVDAARRQAATFTWTQTAARTAAAYERALSVRSRARSTAGR